MNKPLQILIIEDDPDIVKILKLNISEVGAQLDHAEDGQRGLELAQTGNYSLVVLDLMLPKLGGIEVCKRIRENDKLLPILMLTGKSEEVEKIVGLEVGADDYLCKPFSTRELIARIKALLRRSTAQQELTNEKQECLSFPGLTIDLEMRRVTVDGNEVALSVIEFELLTFLAKHPGRPFTREELTSYVWESYATSLEGTINSQLSRLRKKVEPDPANPKYLLTVWGHGYRFARIDELE